MNMNLEKDFTDFHRRNPDVYKWLVHFSREAKKAGFNQYSVNGIFERMRWHLSIDTQEREGFKLNNNHRSRYARMIMENEQDLDGFFEIRELKTA